MSQPQLDLVVNKMWPCERCGRDAVLVAGLCWQCRCRLDEEMPPPTGEGWRDHPGPGA